MQFSEELLLLAARHVRFEWVAGGSTPVPYPWASGWRVMPMLVIAQFTCAVGIDRQDGSYHRFKPSETMAVAPGAPHNIIMVARDGGTSHWCHLVCEVFHGVSLFHFIEPSFCLRGSRSATMLALIDLLNQIGPPKSLAQLLQLQVRGWQLIIKLIEGQPLKEGRADFFLHLSRLAPVMALIEENLAGPITHDLLAREAGLSRSRFHYVFRGAMGCAPYEYVRRLRLRRAQQLLLQSDLSIAQIADRVGHPDPFHFSRVFRRSLGLSPAQYRKQMAGRGLVRL